MSNILKLKKCNIHNSSISIAYGIHFHKSKKYHTLLQATLFKVFTQENKSRNNNK